jgi:hypothetical protein
LKVNATRIGLLVGLSSSCVVAAACSAVLGGIEPGIYDAPREAGADGTTGDGSSSGDGGGMPDRKIADRMIVNDVISPSGDGGCPAAPDPAKGIFVSVGESDTPTCGTSSGNPCGTIGKGLARAEDLSLPIVYVSAGTYTESITVTGGNHIFGGYAANTFAPICSNANQAVIVQAPADSNVTVRGSNLDDTVQIANLTIASKAMADPGESLYGVFVTGGTAALELDDVQISVQAGGEGATGASGSGGADGGSNCSPGSGDNADTAGGVGSDGEGSWSASGYTPGSGKSGELGPMSGEAGVIVSKAGCVDCIVCKALCIIADAGVKCGTQGHAGCGGGPGTGGKGGGGGGSSVGAFFWHALLKTSNGSIASGNGGAGGPGGPGGPGGIGGPPTDGTPTASCTVTCTGIAVGCSTSDNAGAGGVNGNGGNGSSGGAGGGGSGGSSYAVYIGGGGKLVSSVGTTFTVGDAGAGAGDAGSGVAKMQGP